jgi:hypothetical protein
VLPVNTIAPDQVWTWLVAGVLSHQMREERHQLRLIQYKGTVADIA